MKWIWYFLKLARPLFLVGGFLLYFLGAIKAASEGIPLNWVRYFTGQALITTIQLMTHFANEYYDQEGDRQNPNRTWFSGGSGVLPSGEIAPTTAIWASRFFALLGFIFLIAASWQVPVVLLFGGLGLLSAWSYSGPPLKLVSTGLGELSASLVVAFFVPIVGYVMQTGGKISLTILVLCLPLVLIHFAMLIAFQIPDYQADLAVGKRTLAVRLGLPKAALAHNLSLLIAFCVILGLFLVHWPGIEYAWFTIPLAVWQAVAAWQAVAVHQVVRKPPRSHLWLTMGALALFAGTSMLAVLGLLLLTKSV